VPPTQFLFALSAGGAVLTMLTALLIRPSPARKPAAERAAPPPLRDLLFIPGLTTTANPASAGVGASITDVAHLTGGDDPTGTITWKLYGPNDNSCTGTPVNTAPVSVTGDGTYTSPALTPGTAGTYQWVASYSGDTNNVPIGNVGCGGLDFAGEFLRLWRRADVDEREPLDQLAVERAVLDETRGQLAAVHPRRAGDQNVHRMFRQIFPSS